MRLFEVESGSAFVVLRVLQGLANEYNQTGEIPYAAFLNKMRPFDFPLGGPNSDRQKMIAALKNLDPRLSAIIKDVKPDGTIVLDKNNEPSNAPATDDTSGSGSTVDQMAASNSKQLSPNL